MKCIAVSATTLKGVKPSENLSHQVNKINYLHSSLPREQAQIQKKSQEVAEEMKPPVYQSSDHKNSF